MDSSGFEPKTAVKEVRGRVGTVGLGGVPSAGGTGHGEYHDS
jgi:hypothetical protein